ncbi:MAG: hypothetical protein JST00_14085 [Deltaproteobacteria bacterium]|nr:hypothetical protein [Deltaproteobacteria bacterium]
MRRGLRRFVGLGIGFFAFVGVPSLQLAHAQPSDASTPKLDNRARAQQLFDSALADAEAGNLASACPKFLASQEADPKTSTLLNLGACYEKNGQTASAWGAFREAETLARKIGRADWATNARSHAEALEPRLVRLTIMVPEGNAVPGLVILRDGARLSNGEWGVPIPVDPGEHAIRATAEGYTPWETKQSVREVSASVTVPQLVEKPRDPVVMPLDGRPIVRQGWWTPLRTGGVVALGVGGAAMVLGVVLGVVANGNYNDARDKCQNNDPRACTTGDVSASNSAYSLAGVGTGVFIGGAIAAAAGAGIVIFAPGPREGAAASKPTVRVGLGSVGGTF